MIDWTIKDGVCELTLNQAPCNEIGTRMLGALEGFLAAFDPNETRAVIIHSAIPSGFCAGADLRELYEEMRGKDKEERVQELRGFLDRIHQVMDTLDMLPVTTISAIHGVCFGGGFELALTTDIRVVDPTARFCFPELRLGIIPGFGGIPRLKRDVSNALVRDLLMTGRSINAKKAVACSLASQLVGRGEALDVARRIAQQATLFDPITSRMAKEFIKPLPKEELAQEKAIFVELFQSPVVEQALKTFVESEELRPYLPGAA
jgi:enoyl-CoA hydratase